MPRKPGSNQMTDTTELWETLAETMEALAEHHPEIADSDLWRELINLKLINEES